MRKLSGNKRKSKITNDFFLPFNDIKFGKSSLFCCNGYRHAIFKIIFYESHIEKLYTKEKKGKIVNEFFNAVLLHFYDLYYLNSTKNGCLIKNRCQK